MKLEATYGGMEAVHRDKEVAHQLSGAAGQLAALGLAGRQLSAHPPRLLPRLRSVLRPATHTCLSMHRMVSHERATVCPGNVCLPMVNRCGKY